jgi:adenylate kinase
MNIILLGPQGSGKGTQAQFLAKDLNISNFSIGRALRKNIKNKTKLGNEVKKYVKNGELVPIELSDKLVAHELSKAKYKKGIILDGYPRDLAQVISLEKIVKIDYLILIEISEKESIKRLSGRRVCACGENYHIEFKKPKNDMICDKDGKVLKQRNDDYPDAIKERLNVYHTQTAAVIDYYRKHNKVLKINGEASINEVYTRIKKALNEKGLI